MNIEVEVHCHTNIVKHAYSTILEMVQFGKEAGLRGVAITDHGPGSSDGAPLTYFGCMSLMSDEAYGVRIIKGAELSILQTDGEIDLPDNVLKNLDWVIASIHEPKFDPREFDKCTSAYMNVLDNPYVDMLGHTGRFPFPYDCEKVVKHLIELDKVMEFNEHSFDKAGSRERCAEIAKICKKYGAKVCIGSDAHFATGVGRVPRTIQMLEEIDYPEKLILNREADRFFDYLETKKRRLQNME